MNSEQEDLGLFENAGSPAMPYGAYMRGEKADMMDKIHPEEIVELLRNRLMGKELNDKHQWVTNPMLANNAISEIGAWDLSNLILSVSNFNVSISNLDDKTIRKRAYSTMETAVKMMLANWKEYKITNTAQISFNSDIVFSICLVTLKHADKEGIRKMIIGTRSETHNLVSSENKKKSFFREQ